MGESNRDRGGGFLTLRLLGVLWFVACTAVGACLIAKGRLVVEASPSRGSAAVRAASYDGSPVAGNVYRPIEQVRVGQRVVTPGTEAGVLPGTAVDPATWKLLHLRMTDRWPDGTEDVTDVRTVQPPQWVGQVRAAVGSRVPIPLDLAEMGEPAGAMAEVVSVDPCPPIEAGPGRVVLTTVSHLNAFLFDLTVRGEGGPTSSVTVTGWHKLYSEDRAAWASVCELRVGETLRGRDGPLTVASLARHPGVETVYNMTVEGEHQYYVAGARLLAHNANCWDVGPYNEIKKPSGDGLDAHHVPQASEAERLVPGYNRNTGRSIAVPPELHQQLPKYTNWPGNIDDLTDQMIQDLGDAGAPPSQLKKLK